MAFRMQQAIDRLDRQEDRGAGDEGELRHAGQGLGLAVAEAVLAVGRLQGAVDGQQIERRG